MARSSSDAEFLHTHCFGCVRNFVLMTFHHVNRTADVEIGLISHTTIRKRQAVTELENTGFACEPSFDRKRS